MTTQSDLEQMARMASDATELAAAGQTAALEQLLAEMRALAALIPGAAGARGVDMPLSAEAQARQRADDAEVEAMFDNMPV